MRILGIDFTNEELVKITDEFLDWLCCDCNDSRAFETSKNIVSYAMEKCEDEHSFIAFLDRMIPGFEEADFLWMIATEVERVKLGKAFVDDEVEKSADERFITSYEIKQRFTFKDCRERSKSE